jgi:hypothetical protein
VFVHGIHLSLTSTIEAETYGAATSGEDLGAGVMGLDSSIVDGTIDASAPRQLVGVEYYGTHPDPSFTDDDIAYVEEIPYNTPASIERYARVVSRFIAHRMQTSGAHSLHLLCHSMGCTVTRFLVENDLGGIASDGKLTRVTTVSGAVQGAAMANMVDNPVVQQYAGTGAFNIWDISALDPDHVREVAAPWNHDLTAADNPTWRGILISSLGGSDPTLDEAANLFSLDSIHNPHELPNDAIVFTLEAYFPKERVVNRVSSLEGRALLPSFAVLHDSHNEITRDEGAHLLASSALYGHTRVRVALSSVTLVDDHEHHSAFDGNLGAAPAEVSAEMLLSLPRPDGIVLVDERKVSEHTPDVTIMSAGDTVAPDVELFSGFVPDDQQDLQLALTLVEVDHYVRFDIDESTLFPTSTLTSLTTTVPLVDGSVVDVPGTDAQAQLTITVDHVR